MTPDGFVDDALARLRAAVDERSAPLRNLALATTGVDGAPENRTVVLRAFTPDPLVVTIWTDARAGKVSALGRDGRAALLGWSEPEQLQIRLDGIATLHRGDAEAHAAWDGIGSGGRRAYGLEEPPGTPIGAPDAVVLPDEIARFRQFALVRVAVHRLDVLRLGPHGAQTRARRVDGATHWVAP